MVHGGDPSSVVLGCEHELSTDRIFRAPSVGLWPEVCTTFMRNLIDTLLQLVNITRPLMIRL